MHIWRSNFCDMVWKCIQQFSCIRKWSVEDRVFICCPSSFQWWDGSPIDKQMTHSEHPFLLTMFNITLEGWMTGIWYLFCQTWKSVIWRNKWIISYYLVTTCPYVDSNYIILLQDFYCRLSKIQTSHTIFGFMVLVWQKFISRLEWSLVIQKNTIKFVASGVVMDYIDDMFVVIAWFQLKMLIILILDVNVVKCQMLKRF